MQSVVPSAADLPVRRAGAVVHAPSARVRPESAWRDAGWSQRATGPSGRDEHAEQAPIDLDVLWEDLDGLLGQAAASSGARRVSPLRPGPGDVVSAYRAGTRGFEERTSLVDAFV